MKTLTSWYYQKNSQWLVKIIINSSFGQQKSCRSFHVNPINRCWHISVWTKRSLRSEKWPQQKGWQCHPQSQAQLMLLIHSLGSESMSCFSIKYCSNIIIKRYIFTTAQEEDPQSIHQSLWGRIAAAHWHHPPPAFSCWGSKRRINTWRHSTTRITHNFHQMKNSQFVHSTLLFP